MRRGSRHREDRLNARRPAAVLFDMDGTLVDTERLWGVALHDLAIAYGGRMSEAARLAMVGVAMAESMELLHADIGQPWRDPVESARRLEDLVLGLFEDGLPWRPGARRLLREVRAAGVPTALVTSTSRRVVEVALHTLGADSFDVVVCGDEVTAAKPDPTPYLMAAASLGVPVRDCVAVEDSPSGVISARTAGAVVLGVPHEVELPGGDGVRLVPSLAGVDLDLLGELLPSRTSAGGGASAG